MTKVIIDGVEYIPAREVITNEEDIARGLLTLFWGKSLNKNNIKELIDDDSICVYVGDELPDGGEYTLRNVLDEIAKQTL